MEELAGAGGTCCAGGGGYTGGTGDSGEDQSENGLSGGNGTYHYSASSPLYEGGGGYFEGGEGIDLNGIDRQVTCFGGIYNQGSDKSLSHESGSGGTAGSGGTVNVASTATVYAYNGNLYTDGTNYLDGLNQCPIYLQNSIVVAKYTYLSGVSGGGRWKFTLSLVSSQSTAATAGYVNSAYNSVSDDYRYITKNSVLSNVDMSTQGVGSGAGYIEVSNGTYTIDSSMNTAVQSDT